MNKDVMIFLIQMMFKRWKKNYITKGGWKKPKNLIILFLCKIFYPLYLVLWGLYNIFKYKGWLPKKSLQGNHVFLTGAGSGIGRLMAIELAKQECNLSLSDVNMAGLEETSMNLFIMILFRKLDSKSYWIR
jgi:hypothetical protein